MSDTTASGGEAEAGAKAAGDSAPAGGLLTTPLHAWHRDHGGRLVPFAGWDMPVQYASIVEEHLATRRGCGLFDVSHMGRLAVTGPGSRAWLEEMLTRRVADLQPGGVRYTLITDDDAGSWTDVHDELGMMRDREIEARSAGVVATVARSIVRSGDRGKVAHGSDPTHCHHGES